MNDISFGSTFRIPITHAGINAAKKQKLKTLILSYPNGLIGNNKTGYARVSIANVEDAQFLRRLKGIGYKVYQKFDGENIDKNNLDTFIKSKLDSRDFMQKGKNPDKLPRQIREKKRYDRSFNSFDDLKPQLTDNVSEVEKTVSKKLTPDEIRLSDDYKNTVKNYGKEFAEVLFFGIE